LRLATCDYDQCVPERVLIADRGDAGCRLDLVIRRHMADISRATRTRVQSWVVDGLVSVNARVVARVSSRVVAGDTVVVQVPDDDVPADVLPEDRPIERLFEDKHLLIVNKPAGIVSHPTFRHPDGSLLNALLFHARDWPAPQRPSLVGRLDKLTSGAVVVAKSTDAHAQMQRTFASRSSVKEYLAVVHGPVPPSRGEIALRLRRDPDDRRRVVATQNDGAASLTRFERIDAVDTPPLALMRCELVTGRMHQIRVHLSACGWPIVGDAKYGGDRSADTGVAFPRQALHAWRLSFRHPFTGAQVMATAPVPTDMRELMARYGWNLTI
jgi:23S rRNA pseudouridine1911/1915/1917 synthase